jgi:hypothetical protein
MYSRISEHTPALPHYYCCEELNETRSDLDLGSIGSKPGDHVQFLSEVKRLAGGIIPDSE